MDKVAFLIIAHKNPEQLRRLVGRLVSERVVFFIHVDKKVDIKPFEYALDDVEVVWLKRSRSQWGSIGMIKAIMGGLEAIRLIPGISRVTLLSGMDYPLKPVERILKFFDEHPSSDFIDIVSFDQSGWSEAKIQRIRKYYFFVKDKLFEYPINPNSPSLLRKMLDMGLSLILPKTREFPKGLVAYGGWVWFSFSRETVRDVLSFHAMRPDLMKYVQHCLSSDEIYLHTVLGNLQKGMGAVRPGLTYAKWPQGDVPHPAVLTSEHFEELKSLPHLFARKFDETTDKGVLDRIDTELLTSLPTNG
ncbi:hypothetical protein BFP72_03985 [Reichenbachiella sp. 5M10]|uniref:beta-1,6-N-acetylglucosaminyltransferase n=1 Tax=Reichenbachiella sp. 5M10 TaxID=1889772 RepID=UPI000C153B51|nr:beta-1,6-N-acetylglucosaminyltransferase [Reichenbachiella sp. 5M10]PIB34627.1 hypothetical protein BFP72_03985 [Reichenbachiella sp. 5M10]